MMKNEMLLGSVPLSALMVWLVLEKKKATGKQRQLQQQK